MNIDPKVTCEKQTGKFVILAAINDADNKPYPLVIDPTTGELLVNAEFTGDVQVDIDLPDVLSGKTFTLSGGIDQLPAVVCKAGANIQADGANVASEVWLGGNDVAINNGYPLPSGEDIPIATQNLSHVYVIGTLGDKIHYMVG